MDLVFRIGWKGEMFGPFVGTYVFGYDVPPVSAPTRSPEPCNWSLASQNPNKFRMCKANCYM
jgi:hypothetical protein